MTEGVKILVVTRGDYVTRLTLDPLLRNHPPDRLHVVIVTADSNGRSGLAFLSAMWRDYDWRYFFFELFQFVAFQCAQLVLTGTPFSVRRLAAMRNIPVTVTDKVNAPRVVALARDWQPDILVSVKCTQRIRAPLLSVARLGAINVHGSLLPTYAGRAPHFWAMSDGVERIGATAHTMTESFDEGAILSQESIDLARGQSVFMVVLKVAELGGTALMAAVTAVLDGVAGKSQDISQRSYYSSPTTEAYARLKAKGFRLFTIRQVLAVICRERRTVHGSS